MTVEVRGYGKITASKATLNGLSIIFDNAEELYKTKGNPDMAKIMNGASWDIYNALNAAGYYDDMKR
jgi:hypothetical protein